MSVSTITAPRAARARQCPLCETLAGIPCQLKPVGDHLARYLDAYTAGQLTRGYMAAVLGELVVIDTCTVITVPAQPSGASCKYCAWDGQSLVPCCDRHPGRARVRPRR
jgi:hypothetical protein